MREDSATEAMPRKMCRMAGFSLVEVVLALGLVSFCLVALLSLLSVAFASSKESAFSTEGGMLFRKIVSQLRVKPFTTAQTGNVAVYPLPALNNPAANSTEFFVDGRGEFCGMASGVRPAQAAHGVRVIALTAPDLKIDGMKEPVPASDGQIAFVRVEISPAALFVSGTTRPQHSDVYLTEIFSLEQ